MKEISLTKGKIAIVDDDMFEYLNQWKWYYGGHGYAQRFIYENGGTKAILMHRLILNTPDGMDTDHINRNQLDNRKCNLRICTRSQNNANSKLSKNNKSGKKGVSWDKRTGKWMSTIKSHGKTKYLGRYQDLDIAANVYIIKAKELFGEFAY